MNLGVFSQSNLTKQTTGYSKIQRPLSFSGTLPGTIEITEVRKRSDNILDESKHKLLDEDETKALPNGNMLKINIDSTSKHILLTTLINVIELQDIFREVFSETEVLQKIQGKLKNYISKENKGSEQAVEYSIQTDYQAVANYMMSTLSDVMNKKFSEEDSSKIPIKQVSETLVESNQKKLATQQEEQRKDLSQDYKSLMNDSLKESLYGGSVQVFPRISKGRDSLAQSLNSSMDNKTLSNMGVRLVLKYEAGKPRLISVPTVDYSIIEAHSSNEVENLATSMNIDKNLCIKFR